MKFLKANWKKMLVLTVMVALLVGTGVLNWALANKKTTNQQVGASTTVETFFEAYKTERTSSRQEEFLMLQTILKSENASASAKSEAEKRIFDLTKRIEKEQSLEGLIKAKGFDDVVVSMSDTKLSIIVSKETLTDIENTQICNIAVQETDFNACDIRILPY